MGDKRSEMNLNSTNMCLVMAGLWLAVSAAAVGQPMMTPPVVVAPVVQREVAAMQMFVGTVMPVKKATIGSAVDGRVVEFPIEEGQRVESGEKLAQLLTETIKLELAAAEAELELRQHQLEQLVNGSRPEEIEQARARMAAAKLRHEFLVSRRDRMQAMGRNRGAISEEQLEEAISSAGEAEQAYFEAQAAYQLAVEGPRAELIAQAKDQVAIQQALVENLRDRIQKHTIISRFAGYVTTEHTEIGQWVNRGDPIAEVVALDQVEVVAQVVEASIPFVRPSAQVRVEIPTYGDRLFEGTVIMSSPQADLRARTFPVRVLIENEITEDGPTLRAGMYARVALPVGKQKPALLVPKDAIVLGGPQPMVYVVDTQAADSQSVVRPVPVSLGVSSGPLIEVSGQLAEGDQVVVEGNERLRPQQPVQVMQVREARQTSSVSQ